MSWLVALFAPHWPLLVVILVFAGAIITLTSDRKD